jgi:RNA polymerase sigma-70 factor (ECF subfamily)
MRGGSDVTDGSLSVNEQIDEVLRTYADMVYKLALSQTKNRADADDVFQEVFVRYMRNTKPFASEEHQKAWLIRVTINCSRKLMRSAWFRRTVALTDRPTEPPTFDTKEKSEVYEAVLRLPRKYRTAIHLFYYEDMSIADIGKALRLPESTVKSHLARARRLLKQQLEGEWDHEYKLI